MKGLHGKQNELPLWRCRFSIPYISPPPTTPHLPYAQSLHLNCPDCTDTSRPRKETENDGKDYHFVPRHVFEQDIAEHKFVEYGEYEKALYGTSLEAIRQVVSSGKICVLNLYPQVCLMIVNKK